MDFQGFKDSFVKSNTQLSNNSGTVSGDDSVSPAPELAKQKSLNIPIIKLDDVDVLLSRSLEMNKTDIRRQLSQSLQLGGHGSSGGISKPQSRKNSIIPVRSNNGSDAEDDDDDDKDQGNERKRRDNINEKIQELLTLIPPELFQDTNKDAKNSGKTKDVDSDERDKLATDENEIAAAMKNSGTKDGKPNKGQILTKSVEYLQYLQNLIDENNHKEVELIMKLRTLELRSQNKSSNIPINVGTTSAEKALGKIGVGPMSEEYFKNVLVRSAASGRSQRRGSG